MFTKFHYYIDNKTWVHKSCPYIPRKEKSLYFSMKI